MSDAEERGRLERIRAAKRALRRFQLRRELEQSKRASRTLRASVVVPGGDAPTLLTQSYKATNTSQSSARESAQRATEASRRRHSRSQSILSDTNGTGSKRSSLRNSQRFSMSGIPGPQSKRRSVHVRNPSVAMPAQLPPPAGRRPMSIRLSHPLRTSVPGGPGAPQPDAQNGMPQGNGKRRSRHSRQLSISTRRESFEVMSGRSFAADHRASLRQSRLGGRGSVRFSALEAASVLFHASTMQKPLPPVPNEWRAGLFADDDDEGQDRVGALEKLEGRSSAEERVSTDARRSSTPSWLHSDAERAQNVAPCSAPEESLDTLVEEDEEEHPPRSHGQSGSDAKQPSAPSEVPSKDAAPGTTTLDATPADAKLDSDTSADTSHSLRPLQLSSLQASGTPLLGSVRGLDRPSSKAARRMSNIYYKPPPSLDPTDANKTEPSAPLEPPTRVEGFARGHQAASSRSAQSSNTSWPQTEAAGSMLFSPKSVTSGSPGGTSVESNDHTPKQVPRVAEPTFVRLQSELQAIRDRHQHEITELQREVEEVRHVMGAQLAQVTGARDMLEKELFRVREHLEEAQGERDMYVEDVQGWRTRCSDLEQTIQSQQLRFKQEQSWRHAATKRMQTLSNRLKTHESSFDSNSSLSQLASVSSASSMSPSGADRTLEPIPDLPDLPQMPTDDELGGWSMQVARQLSKHTPVSSPSHDLAPETVHLLSDMRQQIMSLYSELKLEQSNHELTRTQLHELKQAQAVRHGAVLDADASASTFTPADATHADDKPVVWTPQKSATSARRGRHAFLNDTGLSHEPTDEAETTADILFGGQSKHGSLVGLGLSSPDRTECRLDATPRPETRRAAYDAPMNSTARQDTWLDESHSWSGSDLLPAPLVTEKPDTARPAAAHAGVESPSASLRQPVQVSLDDKPSHPASQPPHEAMRDTAAAVPEPSQTPQTLESPEPATSPDDADTLFAPPAGSTDALFDAQAPGATPLDGALDAPTAPQHVSSPTQTKPPSTIGIPTDLSHDAGELSPDLEAGEDSAWVDEEDVETPDYPRPEFIPEWSFDQAMFEAAQDIRVYELSGCKPHSKQSRRGAARLRPPPVDDFFGILDAEDLKPALPLPSYALDMPPVDLAKLQAPPAPRADATSKPVLAHVGRAARSMLGRSTYTEDATGLPYTETPATALAMPSMGPDIAEPTGLPQDAKTSSPFLTQMLSPLTSPWARSEKRISVSDCEAQAASPGMWNLFESPQSTPIPSSSPEPTTPTYGQTDRLAPSIPPPSTPVPRSPDSRLASPNSTGLRYIRPDAQTRIPVPTPVWGLNFTHATATPQAPPPFMI